MKLPQQLFVKIDGEKGDEFFNATVDEVELAKMGETANIGTYELVETHTAKGMAILNNSKPVKRSVSR